MEVIIVVVCIKWEWRILNFFKIYYVYGDLRDKKYVNVIVIGCYSIVYMVVFFLFWGKFEVF